MEFTALQITGIMFLSALFLIGTGLPIVYCLGSVGTLSAIFLWGEGALDIVYFATLDLASNILLVVCPLFMFMGFVLHESRIAKDLFDAVYLWSGRLRGALGMGTMLICALMAAMLGVSSATVLSMGIIAVPAMLQHKYNKRLTWKMIHAACRQTFALSGFVAFVVIASLIFSKVYTGLGATIMLKRYILELGANPLYVMIFIQLSFVILGCFIDDMAILFMTMPIYYPIVTALGYDPVWFGILFVINMQMAYITPPYGLNLFYMKSVAPDSVSLKDIYWAVIPFLAIQFLFLIFCMLCPEVITWLPNLIFG